MSRIDPRQVRQRADLLARLADDPDVDKAADLLLACLRSGGKILTFGNGGSATQASHFAAELVNRFAFNRPALAALSLANDAAALTSIANDFEFDRIFARQVEALGRPGDVALGLTTSGRSVNVLAALREARRLGLTAVALSGRQRAMLDEAGAQVVIAVDSTDTPAVQEMHLFLLHALAEILEHEIFGGPS